MSQASPDRSSSASALALAAAVLQAFCVGIIVNMVSDRLVNHDYSLDYYIFVFDFMIYVVFQMMFIYIIVYNFFVRTELMKPERTRFDLNFVMHLIFSFACIAFLFTIMTKAHFDYFKILTLNILMYSITMLVGRRRAIN